MKRRLIAVLAVALPFVPAPAAGRTVIVQPGASIAAAVAAATAGDVVQVQAGVYRETVRLRSDITIDGAGRGEVRIEPGSAPAFVGGGVQRVTLRGMTIAGGQVGVHVERADAITVAECDFKGSALVAVDSRGIRVQRNTFDGAGRNNAIVLQATEAVIAENVVFDHAASAVVVIKQSRAELTGNLLDFNAAGVTVAGSSVWLDGNTISGPGDKALEDAGVGVRLEDAQIAARKNSVSRYRIGILVLGGEGDLTNNAIIQNLVGIHIRAAALAVTDNTIQLNEADGAQVLASEAAAGPGRVARVTRNVISYNGGVGIRVSGATVELAHNVVDSNAAGIRLHRAPATVRNNTLVLNHGIALHIGAGAPVTVENNIVAHNRYGIAAEAGVSAQLAHNVLWSNLPLSEFPLLDGNYRRGDRVPTQAGEKIHVNVFPAYDVRGASDGIEDPRFVKLGSDYRLEATSPLASRRGQGGAGIGALPAVSR